MHNLARARRNLMIIEGRKNILWISPIDSVPILVEHENIDEMRPRIDFVVPTKSAAAPHRLVAGVNFSLDPDLIRINGALAERMTQRQGAQDHFKQVTVARLERRQPWTQRRCQWRIYRAAF